MAEEVTYRHKWLDVSLELFESVCGLGLAELTLSGCLLGFENGVPIYTFNTDLYVQIHKKLSLPDHVSITSIGINHSGVELLIESPTFDPVPLGSLVLHCTAVFVREDGVARFDGWVDRVSPWQVKSSESLPSIGELAAKCTERGTPNDLTWVVPPPSSNLPIWTAFAAAGPCWRCRSTTVRSIGENEWECEECERRPML